MIRAGEFILRAYQDADAAEMAAAGLLVVERVTLWGEIWAHCRPGADAADA